MTLKEEYDIQKKQKPKLAHPNAHACLLSAGAKGQHLKFGYHNNIIHTGGVIYWHVFYNNKHIHQEAYALPWISAVNNHR